jgi:hypothetical protein
VRHVQLDHVEAGLQAQPRSQDELGSDRAMSSSLACFGTWLTPSMYGSGDAEMIGQLSDGSG